VTGLINGPQDHEAECDRSRTVSIRDVARAAGVSHQTVSRVINHSPSVSDRTRESVLATISSLGFRPNRAARALAGGPLQSVTVLAGNTHRWGLWGYAAALQGVEETIREVGFGMGFRTIEESSPKNMRAAVAYAAEPAGALIVIAFDQAGALALENVPADIPTVALVQAPRDGVAPPRPSVWIDEFAAARQAVEYLLALGHETVRYLAIPSWSGPNPREQGWQAALEHAGAPVPAPVGSGWTAQWGHEMTLELLRDDAPTAILCGNDDIALGAIRAVSDTGRSVPADVSIIGFDDVPFARFSRPALTTVRQDFTALGRASVATLLEQVGGRRPGMRLTAPEAELIVRETTGPPPTRSGPQSRTNGMRRSG
jgi:DNA-binding LacI/PurR family transcriptional regulator